MPYADGEIERSVPAGHFGALLWCASRLAGTTHCLRLRVSAGLPRLRVGRRAMSRAEQSNRGLCAGRSTERSTAVASTTMADQPVPRSLPDPHPSRLAHDDPHRSEILAAHAQAVSTGEAAYVRSGDR